MTVQTWLRRRGGSLALWAICVAPVLVFYVLLWREMRPVPMFDDYHAVMQFALDLQNQPGPAAKILYVLAAQHDEYKLVVLHATEAADLVLTGHLHFGLLIWSGNLLVLGVAALLCVHAPRDRRCDHPRLLFLLPVLLLLFQLNYVENLDWAMCGLQTMSVIFFSMAALHLVLQKGKVHLALACLALVLASLSSANGFFVAPIGGLWLLLERRFLAIVAWSATAVFATAIYLFHYTSFVPPRSADAITIGRKIVFFLSFVGGAVENMHHQPVPHAAIVLGAIVVLVLAHAGYTRFYRAHRFIASVAVWSLMSAAVVAQVRSAQGANLSLTGRYKIYSDLLLICCYVYVASGMEGRVSDRCLLFTRMVAVSSAVLFAFAGDINGYRFLVHRRQRVALGLTQYAADPARVSPEISLGGEPFAGPDPEAARIALNEAQARGLYKMPESPAQR